MVDAAQRELIQAALDVRKQAYAPYSNFLVGAAVRTGDGTVFTGCNIENASYGLTICAERIAAATAIAAGHRELSLVAVATAGGATPCGACRQFLAEFGPSMEVLLVDAEKPDLVTRTTLDRLLPAQFHLDDTGG